MALGERVRADALRPAAEQVDRIDQQALGAGVDVERPQAVRRIVAGLAAQEQHHRAIRGNSELVRDSKGEALSANDLIEEGIGRHSHHPTLSSNIRSS
ncbi:hypothetical protein [Fodinicola feengrottensis]|uniref:hypothetical protein n=1 Tax=Fodinicola feengrottensis TaxID=435914 RepID=UPI002441A3FE|nr:hypothetical protein [Fodinicola feengrottensis]